MARILYSNPPYSRERPPRLDIVGPNGIINIHNRCLNGTTLHFYANHLYRYKGHPRCISTHTHSTAEQCLKNYDGTAMCHQRGRVFNFWIHYPADGSDAWVQKDLVYLIDRVAFRNVLGVPGHIIYVPRRYAIIAESLIFCTFVRVKIGYEGELEKAIHKPSQAELKVLRDLVAILPGETNLQPKVVLCENLDGYQNAGNCISWENDILYRQNNCCSLFPYLEMAQYPKFILPVSEIHYQKSWNA